MKGLNKTSKYNKIGFWYSEYEPHLPKPVPNTLTEQEAEKIYELIQKKDIKRFTSHKGSARSRITGEKLGSREYICENWIWPELYPEHYILEYRCKPTDDFLKFIEYDNITKNKGIKRTRA